MKEIDVLNWNRYKTYEWFRTFSNSTYGMNVKIDVTNLVNRIKERKESFFIDLLFVVVKSLNEVDEMRMRIVDNKPVIFDDINPAFTVMTKSGTFENVRFDNKNNFKDFYEIASKYINDAKEQLVLSKDNYNPENCYNEYYISCVPIINFESVFHPMPDSIESQCIPRLCWGKYVENNGKYELTMNITVSHIFVDGFPLANVFNKIQDYLNDLDSILN